MADYLPLFSKDVYENPIPPRFQWNHNGGYCGETSFIASGLYYGQYLSQYDVRSIASDGKKQNEKGADGVYGDQLLLGVNDTYSAQQLRLAYDEWPRKDLKDTKAFMQWIKEHALNGHPVIIGVFNNFRLLGEESSLPGDSQYDHIVPVLGYGTTSPAQYDDNDIIVFSDNGLYTPGNSIPFYHQFRMQPDNAVVPAYPFLGDRKDANKADGNVYSVLDLATADSTHHRNFAIAITGVADTDNVTLPVRITTDINYEIPAIGHDSNTRPETMNLGLTVSVSGLQANIAYNLYEYDHESKVPAAKFNTQAANAKKKHHINITEGDSFTFTFPITSDQKVFFRAVPASAD
ncbi:MAG: hypothetical protein HEP71_11040 [Roseivirga sp.]|nr:hypothetical protein [Roseivirga sp.]